MTANRCIVVGRESRYGTATTPTDAYDMAGESLKRRHTRRPIRAARRVAANRQVETERHVEGAIDLYMSYRQSADVLGWLVGAPDVEILEEGAAARYTFVPDPQYRPESLTIDVARDLERHRYTGVVFTGHRLSLGASERWLGMSLQCIGADEQAVSGLPSLVDADFVAPGRIGRPGSGTFWTLSISDGDTTWNASVRTCEISAAWDRRLRRVDRSLTPVGIIGGGVVTVGGKVAWVYSTATDFLLDAMRSMTPVSLTLTIQGTLIAGTTYETLEILLPQCQVNGDPPTVRGRGYGNLDFNVDLPAFLDDDAGYPIRYRVTTAAPVISSISPSSGPTAGGTTVTITGADLL